MPGTLFVVATPIGNLEDITLRALRTLREVALVAAEDTRRTGNLLRHYQITTPLLSLHEHNEHARITQVIARLEAGDSIALVSDAGTPGISDPGALLVHAARKAGIRVDPVPGASAVTAILSASGLSADKFAFAGFPPVRSLDRKAWFDWVANLADVPVVCFEAPHRVTETLRQMRTLLVGRPIAVARELTKAHEEWTFIAPGADTNVLSRGEFVIVVGQSTNLPGSVAVKDEDIVGAFEGVMAAGTPGSRRDAIRQAAERLGVAPNTAYEVLERVKSGPPPPEAEQDDET